MNYLTIGLSLVLVSCVSPNKNNEVEFPFVDDEFCVTKEHRMKNNFPELQEALKETYEDLLCNYDKKNDLKSCSPHLKEILESKNNCIQEKPENIVAQRVLLDILNTESDFNYYSFMPMVVKGKSGATYKIFKDEISFEGSTIMKNYLSVAYIRRYLDEKLRKKAELNIKLQKEESEKRLKIKLGI